MHFRDPPYKIWHFKGPHTFFCFFYPHTNALTPSHTKMAKNFPPSKKWPKIDLLPTKMAKI